MAKAKNWAIVVGINAYEHIGQLRYANRDAAALRNFFQEAKFDRVFCFADGLDIPPQSDQKSIQPRHSDLVDFLNDRFTTKIPPLSAGDNCWFFFAGHGKRIHDCDYLLPQDYNPRLPNPTDRAISVNSVREALLKSGADNVILLLDACRTEGDRADGLGIGDEQPGAITIFSCQRNQKAYEIEALQQGAFTAALLEGLRMPKASDNCATVQRLDDYLRRRVPELCRLHPEQPIQNPITAVDPGQKWYLLLLPHVATEPDIAMLKVKAYEAASLDENLELAEQLWIRIIAATNGQDLEALRAYAKIINWEKPLSPTPPLSLQSQGVAETTSWQETQPFHEEQEDINNLSSVESHYTKSLKQLEAQADYINQTLTGQSRISPELENSEEATSPPKTPPANLLPDSGSIDSRSSPPPVRPLYQREAVHPLTHILTPIVQPPKPANSRPQRGILWIRLMILGLLYAIGGMLLTSASAPLWVWAVAGVVALGGAATWAVAVAGVEGGAAAMALPVAMTAALALALAAFLAWTWAVVVAVAVIVAVIVAGAKLLTAFSQFHTFLILAGTSLSGLGLGWLGYWAFKAATGH